MVELLAPAGNAQAAKAALRGGADAIYLGLNDFSARQGAENFHFDDYRNILQYAHILGAKVYVCFNTMVKDGETDGFFSLALKAWEEGADALLVQDMFLGKTLKSIRPDLILHLSTQGGCCNEEGARLAKECGFSRVVLARETPLEEIARISKVIETEVFVQGALCSSFSGQCYFSSFAGGNSGNRGRCKQPCRKQYSIDRTGYDNLSYAISLSDLCVGESIADLIKAGVSSLKIEGRMRRAEYAMSAARYYRALINGEESSPYLLDMIRAYNRGDYTKGLAFGQDKSFLSRNVQGHIGEKMGYLEREKGALVLRGNANKGDGFKVLRGGKEVCGAVYGEKTKNGFTLFSRQKLFEGDEVRRTTCAQTPDYPQRTKKIKLNLQFLINKKPKVTCGDFVFEGDVVLERALNAPLCEDDLKTCFFKCPEPFEVEFGKIETDGVFLSKGQLNAFRRAFFGKMISILSPVREHTELMHHIESSKNWIVNQAENRTAVVAENFSFVQADICVFRPRNYCKLDINAVKSMNGEKFLYLPPFLKRKDLEAIENYLPLFDGIYCDGYYGLVYAREREKKFFAGTGFHISNRYALNEIARLADYVALSKELNGEELSALTGKNVFVLCGGDLQLMDLCYCPFERTCSSCDRRVFYTMTDGEGRKFPLRRVEYPSGCRFEVFNCNPLFAFVENAGTLLDFTLETDLPLLKGQKGDRVYTKGHLEKSVL